MQFQKKLIKSKQENIYQVSERSEGRDVYFVLMVHPYKLTSFLAIKSGENYNITDYGVVLAWGYEKYPPVEVLEAIEKEYDVKLKIAA